MLYALSRPSFKFFESLVRFLNKEFKVADRSPRRSRRLRGLSPPSTEPSPRRRRGNNTGGFRPTAIDASGIDPPLGGNSIEATPGTAVEQERNPPVPSQVPL